MQLNSSRSTTFTIDMSDRQDSVIEPLEIRALSAQVLRIQAYVKQLQKRFTNEFNLVHQRLHKLESLITKMMNEKVEKTEMRMLLEKKNLWKNTLTQDIQTVEKSINQLKGELEHQNNKKMKQTIEKMLLKEQERLQQLCLSRNQVQAELINLYVAYQEKFQEQSRCEGRKEKSEQKRNSPANSCHKKEKSRLATQGRKNIERESNLKKTGKKGKK